MTSYITLAQLKAKLPNNNFGTSLDATLTDMIVTASREIDSFLHRAPDSFAAVDSTRYFAGNGKSKLWVSELAAVPTSVSISESGVVDNNAGTGGTYVALGTSDYWCYPYNSLAEGMPFSALELDFNRRVYWPKYPRSVKVVGKFGFSTTSTMPEEIKKATTIQALRYFKRASQAFADAGAIAELQQLRYVKKLDPDVENILKLGKFAVASQVLP